MKLEKTIATKLENLKETKNNQNEIIAEINIGFLSLGIDANSRLGLLVKALSANTEQAKRTVYNLVDDLKMDLIEQKDDDFYS